MGKTKLESFLSRKKVLDKQQYQEYEKYKKDVQARKYKKEIKELKKESEYGQRQEAYSQTPSGKVGKYIGKAFKTASQRGGITRATYGRSMPPSPSSNSSSLKGVKHSVGRPYGSVKYVDPRTGGKIGVYEYRKLISLERQKVLQQRALNPQQQEALRRINERNMQVRQSPESQVFPDTSGDVYMDNIMDEIDSASNLVK